MLAFDLGVIVVVREGASSYQPYKFERYETYLCGYDFYDANDIIMPSIYCSSGGWRKLIAWLCNKCNQWDLIFTCMRVCLSDFGT